MDRERDEREKQRDAEKHREIQDKVRKEKVSQLASTEMGRDILKGKTMEEIETMDADDIITAQVQELEKRKKELQVRLKKQDKNVDHIERAKRQEEIPLLKLQFEEFKEEARQIWKEQEKKRIEMEVAQRENDVKNRERMKRMTVEKDQYLDGLMKERKNVFEQKLANFNVHVQEERIRRLEQRKEDRIEERRRKWLQDKREEEQRRRDEIAKREKEEREAREEAEREKRAEEDARNRAELEKIEEKKRQKEAEIERRMQEQ